MTSLADIARRNLAQGAGGIYAVCSANPFVIRASLRRAAADGTTALIEATCNQVNQRGGYTGMTADRFRSWVFEEATRLSLPSSSLLLGGDHLGPYPWRDVPADRAMESASELVASYAAAGYGKLHLDASMACAGDPEALPCEVVAERSAALCQIAERAAESRPDATRPLYVIGTEVPTPGGTHDSSTAEPTTAAALADTLDSHRRAFRRHGLESAWERVVAVVAQPGVEFGSADIVDFVPAKAMHLARFIEHAGGPVFEAHSTDYQQPEALRALVQAHFAVLKVGPALTFALREALFALAAIEDEVVPATSRSCLRGCLEEEMLADPSHWRSHYTGPDEAQKLARVYSLSDRCRYYWSNPRVERSVSTLLNNLSRQLPPWALLRQHLPDQADAVRAGAISTDPRVLLYRRIDAALAPYARACAIDDSGRDGRTTPRRFAS